jgi:hypothetical protein
MHDLLMGCGSGMILLRNFEESSVHVVLRDRC